MWTKTGAAPLRSAQPNTPGTRNLCRLPQRETSAFPASPCPRRNYPQRRAPLPKRTIPAPSASSRIPPAAKAPASPHAISNSAHFSFSVHPKTYKRPLYAVIVAVLLGVCQSSKPPKSCPLFVREDSFVLFYRRFTRFPLRARTDCCRDWRRSRFLRAILHACPAPRCRRPSCRG